MKAVAPLLLSLITVLGTSRFTAADEPLPRYDRRWVWVMANLLVDAEADRVVALVERAARDGYNGLVVSDYKLNILGKMPERYFDHVARLRAVADQARIELIPTVFPIGYGNGLLSHDANLAEGMQVDGAPFVVQGGEAVLEPNPAARLANGDLETTRGEVFSGFGFQDAPGEVSFVDREVVHGGKTSCRMENLSKSPVARLIQKVSVRPRACYRFSCWVKTRELTPTGAFRLLAIGASGQRQLTFHEGGLRPTGDWTRVEVVFNSQDQTEVNLYAGVWSGRSGVLWLDDLELEELSLVNVLRRDGCPLTVTTEDGGLTYIEGRDFEPVQDPKLGTVPYNGEFEFSHSGPPLRISAPSRIKNGERLRVSWYHPVLTHGTDVAACLSEPKVYDLLRDQAKRVNDLYHPRTFFMQHDELRVANWCRACQSRKLTPGELLADNARRCVELVKEVNPDAEILVWSDMFDPNHNAVKNYYLVNGTLAGSWLGLDRSVMIANWNGGKAKASLGFFAGRGHRQVIAGYYDHDDAFENWDAAARGVPGVSGFMYTTWEKRYDDLERYGKLISRKP